MKNSFTDEFEVVDIYKFASSEYVIASDKEGRIFNIGMIDGGGDFPLQKKEVEIGKKIRRKPVEELAQYFHEETKEIRYRKKNS